ncbi:MAG TPA: Asp-tRNA(Asn)/Glu-tRNA(Gln) amidotransferase subunit GatB [Tepidisphaeraceae bacterium]|jgi:aspartyl-tRNA(Asn)/glutamyl-tRNA(Gln) amidotransferase subunit B
MAERKCVSHKVLVGLEIHVQLSTKTKMFTGVANASGALRVGDAPVEPNTAVDEQILGLPGTLPVMNKKAVESSIKVGLALGCKIAKFTKWDRKSYYYPDLPKNYQISQYDLPLCYEGTFEMTGVDGQPKTVRIRRAHLEEDAGKLLHDAPGGYHIDYCIVDLNRAGTPLLEVVTEPDLSDPKDVSNFGQELQKLVQHLGVSEGQMQLGHMRFEPNINVHITDAEGKVHKTAITEIKNLNSFNVLERATAYEVQRQIRQWEETGDLGRKSTYGWDDAKQETFLQREKEEAHDYRYFPDPDLMPVEVSDEWLTELKAQIGESPTARRTRYTSTLQLNASDAGALAGDRKLGEYFDDVVLLGANPKRAANLILNTLATVGNARQKRIYDLDIPPGRVRDVAELIDESKLAASNALPLFEKLAESGSAMIDGTAELASHLGLVQVSDTGAIDSAIDAVIDQNPRPLQDYRGGKASALGALTGMVMKQGKGFNAKLVQERLKEKLAT